MFSGDSSSANKDEDDVSTSRNTVASIASNVFDRAQSIAMSPGVSQTGAGQAMGKYLNVLQVSDERPTI